MTQDLIILQITGWIYLKNTDLDLLRLQEVDTRWNMNALVNPYTASRLRRDFQGYTLWGRSGSGSQEDWEMIKRWDKVDNSCRSF